MEKGNVSRIRRFRKRMRDFKSESDTYKKFKTQFGEIDLRQGMNEELLNLDYTNFEEKSCSDEEFEPFNMNEER